MSIQSKLNVRNIVVATLSVVVVVGAVFGYWAMSAKPALTSVNTNADKVAIHGFDTVAYFTAGKPTKGKKEFEHKWRDARWFFASATNRDLFVANPDRYAPRYGGYCSMGVAIGQYSDTDPEQWTIIDGKLYLNKDKKIQAMWRKSPKAYIVGSEINWNKYKAKMHVNENLRWKI